MKVFITSKRIPGEHDAEQAMLCKGFVNCCGVRATATCGGYEAPFQRSAQLFIRLGKRRYVPITQVRPLCSAQRQSGGGFEDGTHGGMIGGLEDEAAADALGISGTVEAGRPVVLAFCHREDGEGRE